MKRILYCLLFFLGLVSFGQNAPTVKAEVDTSKIRIGEQLNYKIIVKNASTGVQFQELLLDSLQRVELVESYKIDTLKDQLIKKYKLTSFDSGTYLIPRQAIFIWNQPYFTDSIIIDVATVAVDTTKQQMYPIKAIQKEPFSFDDLKAYIWWILAFLALLGLILYFIFRKKKSPEEIIAGIPPYELALKRLKELDQKQLWQKNKIKKYYVELTDILRTFIERETNIPALESTTDELIETIKDFNASSAMNIEDDTILKLKQVLSEADLVKFAKYKPLVNEIEKHRNLTEEIIEKLHPKKSIEDEVVE